MRVRKKLRYYKSLAGDKKEFRKLSRRKQDVVISLFLRDVVLFLNLLIRECLMLRLGLVLRDHDDEPIDFKKISIWAPDAVENKKW